jgi:cobalamin biosynthesis Mg chelatase CobN
MGIRALFLVACILAISGLDAAAVERINPHDVLNQTRRDLNAFDKRMERDKAEQQKQEKEAEAKRKQDEAERPNREQAEQALQEAQRKREAAEQQKQAREDKEREARQKQEEAERPNREQAEQAQEAQRKREAAAAEAAKGASLSSPTTTPSRPSTGRAGSEFEEDPTVTASVHPAGPHHLPAFFTAPGETDVLMIGVAVFLVIAVVIVGILFLRLHTLPERIAHKSHKLQFEIVAVLGLLALFTHVHLFWVAGLLLAMIDLPDFGWPLGRIAGAVETMAGMKAAEGAPEVPDETVAGLTPRQEQLEVPRETKLQPRKKELTHA